MLLRVLAVEHCYTFSSLLFLFSSLLFSLSFLGVQSIAVAMMMHFQNTQPLLAWKHTRASAYCVGLAGDADLIFSLSQILCCCETFQKQQQKGEE